MPLVNFRKQFCFFPLIFSRISKLEHLRGDWAYAEPNFLGEISNKNFYQKVHFGLIRWVPERFFKIFFCQNFILIWDFWVIFENYSILRLSIRGNDFIAHWAYEERFFAHAQPVVKCEQFLHENPCWAYAEQISSHTEHMRNEFHRWLSIRRMDFIAGWAYAEMFKSWISRPNRIRF